MYTISFSLGILQKKRTHIFALDPSHGWLAGDRL